MKGSPPFRRTTLRPCRAAFGETLVDRVLTDAGAAAALADEHALGVAAGAIENFRADRLVVENDIGALQRLQGAQGQQIGVARDRRRPERPCRNGRANRRAARWRARARRSASRQRPASAAAPIGPSTTRSQNRRSESRRAASARRRRGSGPSRPRGRRCVPATALRCVPAAAAPAPATRRRCRSRPRHRRDRQWRGR